MKRWQIPVRGVSLREAVASEFSQVVELVLDAVRKMRGISDFHPQGIFPDVVVVKTDAGRYWSYPWSFNADNTVALGVPSEVVPDFEPVGARAAEAAAVGVGTPPAAAADASGVFIEAVAGAAGAPPRYLVRVIRAGTSLNGVHYPREVLREAAPRFAGVRVFAKSDGAHIKGDADAKDFRALVGRLSEPRFGLPHTRGGVSRPDATASDCDASSPHAWGAFPRRGNPRCRLRRETGLRARADTARRRFSGPPSARSAAGPAAIREPRREALRAR